MSRVAFIPKNARRPNAGKLFLDYLISARAQKIMANQATLFSLRERRRGPYPAAALEKELGAGSSRSRSTWALLDRAGSRRSGLAPSANQRPHASGPSCGELEGPTADSAARVASGKCRRSCFRPRVDAGASEMTAKCTHDGDTLT
mgnify:CR=1 FL=1